MADVGQSGDSPMRPYKVSDTGVRITLEALRDIALDPNATVEHKPSGVKLDLRTAEDRLSIIAGGLESVIKHLKERDEDA